MAQTVKDAVVIGGGFYGAAIAIYLARQRGLKRIVLVEREPDLLSRASRNNQARVHNGYHYPRSFATAYRSRVNLPRFVRDWPFAVQQDFTQLYAIARRNSKVTAKQFVRFCREIDARVEPAPPELQSLFEPHLIEAVFQVQEYAFNSTGLRAWAQQELQESGVQIRLATRALSISRGTDAQLAITLQPEHGSEESISTYHVFNCTYSGLNRLRGDFIGAVTPLKHEITELALMQPSPKLKGLGITVMDGPFFSMMPHPSLGLHTLSHVRYTPHLAWMDRGGEDPYQALKNYRQATQVDRMMRDAGRYVPAVLESKHVQSLFEVKTILQKNEIDDGRPTLFERHADLPGCFSVLGGKIDNIYDVLEKLDAEKLTCGVA